MKITRRKLKNLINETLNESDDYVMRRGVLDANSVAFQLTGALYKKLEMNFDELKAIIKPVIEEMYTRNHMLVDFDEYDK